MGVAENSHAGVGPAAPGTHGEDSERSRRALLIGINDYTASNIPEPQAEAPTRSKNRAAWPNLEGAVNDVTELRELLIALYEFDAEDILVLTDQAATRQAILAAIDTHLVEPAGEGDVMLFFYAGHGSQVKNSRSSEPDKLDESLVPADSRRGAPDVRDKELRRRLNPVLDRGARLTVILDSCHSGSGVRGLPSGARPRALQPDLHDVADGSDPGPPLEDRGTLVLSAAQDYDLAWETNNEDGKRRGAFSLALSWVLRVSERDEPAEDTFLRVRARLQAEKRFQEPILAGNDAARKAPLLGERGRRREVQSIVAVERVLDQGVVVLQGGWVNGLSVGSGLRYRHPDGNQVFLDVTEIEGPARSKARIRNPAGGATASWTEAIRTPIPRPEPGSLLEVTSWAVPAGGPLKLWIPSTQAFDTAVELVTAVAEASRAQGIRWITDPTAEVPPTHLLRWREGEWELLDLKGTRHRLGATPLPTSVLDRLPSGCAFFAHLPAPQGLVEAMTFGANTPHDGVESTERLEDAHYLLTGRLVRGGVEYSWVRPDTGGTVRRQTGLPLRTTWHAVHPSPSDRLYTAALDLETAALRLRKIHAWQHLEAPPSASFPYRLVLERRSDGTSAIDRLDGQEVYGLTLVAENLARTIKPRYVFVFVIDSHGKSVLLFPQRGTVENRFPVHGAPPSAEIDLGRDGWFRVTEPYGVDTYFLLTSDEPIPNPWVLEWPGVTRGPRGSSALEELLSSRGGATRSAGRLATPMNWSLEKLIFESVAPHAQGIDRNSGD